MNGFMPKLFDITRRFFVTMVWIIVIFFAIAYPIRGIHNLGHVPPSLELKNDKEAEIIERAILDNTVDIAVAKKKLKEYRTYKKRNAIEAWFDILFPLLFIPMGFGLIKFFNRIMVYRRRCPFDP